MQTFSILRRGAALALLLLLTLPRMARAQGTGGSDNGGGGTEVLRGRVLLPDGKPLTGATVTIVGLQSHITRSTKTDGDGVYTLLFAVGEGEYLVTVRAIGFAPSKERAIRSGDSNILVTDFAMTPVVSRLDAVTVTAQRDTRPVMSGGTQPSIGGDEEDVSRGALFSLDPSDYTTLLRGMPGVTLIPGQGYSVLGASPDQNSTLLNGSTFNGARLPRDAIGSVSMAKTTYDPSRGGFAGGQMSITTRSGTNTHQGTVRTTFNDSRLAWNDPSYPIPASRSQSWSGTVNGPIRENEAFYNFSFDMNRNSSGLQSLLNLNPVALEQSGLIRDTVQTVNAILQQIGVPLTASGIPSQQQGINNSLSLNLNATPGPTSTLTLNLIEGWSRQDGSGISALSYPAFGNGGRSENQNVQLGTSKYLGSYLNEFRGAINTSHSTMAPYVTLPGGSVLVPSRYADGRTGFTTLNFGGSPSGRSSSRNSNAEINDALSKLTVDSRHQVKLAGSVSMSRSVTSAVTDQFGTYSYQSLTDLAANHPASYSRTISSQSTVMSATNSSLSLGDQFRASSHWQFEYGVRMDVAHSGVTPGYNPVVDSLYGRRTDQVPHNVGWSPRFGFNWTQWGEKDMGAIVQRALLAQKPVPTPISISGGFGAFRGVIDPGQISQLANATGLPNTIRQLTCVGDAVPVPQWSSFAADASGAPTQCLDGTAPAVFSTDRPNVQLLDPAYQAPISWRGNVGVNGIRFKEWPINLNTDYSVNLHGQSQIDLNLNRTPVFALVGEGGRPVYVPIDAIVPTSGAIAPGASRLSDRFGSVMSTQSDIKSVAGVVSVSTSSPRPLLGKLPLSLSYAFSNSRSQFRDVGGFDPLALRWSAGQQPTHQFNLMTSLHLWRLSFSTQMILTSGVPYTPTVAGDVNGDGLPGDRAFIPDPSTTPDTALGRQLSTLLSGADPHVRQCLQSQMGRVAGYNSCRTGWMFQFMPNLNVDFSVPNPSKSLAAFNDRIKFSLQTENAMSALSRIFGISNAPLLRNTGYMPLDPTLLYVTGFDPVAQRFQYQVNQQFGDNHRRVAGRAGRAIQPPFRAYLTGEWSFGGPPHRTFAQGLGIVPVGDEPQPSADSVKSRLRQLTASPVQKFLDMRDSLLLSEKQVAQIQKIVTDFNAQVDSLFDPIAHYVVSHGKKTDDEQLSKRIGKVQMKVMKAMVEELHSAAATLTPEQIRRLPLQFQSLLAARIDG